MHQMVLSVSHCSKETPKRTPRQEIWANTIELSERFFRVRFQSYAAGAFHLTRWFWFPSCRRFSAQFRLRGSQFSALQSQVVYLALQAPIGINKLVLCYSRLKNYQVFLIPKSCSFYIFLWRQFLVPTQVPSHKPIHLLNEQNLQIL